MSEQTPRINAPLLGQFTSYAAVRIVGKVLQVNGDKATIDSAGQITVHLNRDSQLVPGNGVEITGKVLPSLEVKALSTSDLGDNVNYAVAEALVDVTHRYKEIFYD